MSKGRSPRSVAACGLAPRWDARLARVAVLMAGLASGLACRAPEHTTSPVSPSDGVTPGEAAAPATPGAAEAEPASVPAPAAATGAPAPPVPAFLEHPAWAPAPGTSPEQHARWSQLVRELFLDDPSHGRRAELEAELAAVDVVEATPAFLEAVRGLDMADPAHVARAAALTAHWYDGQARVLQLKLDADPDPKRAANRIAQLQGWARWWNRRVEDPASLQRFRERVASVRAFLEQDRAQRRAGGG